MTRKTDGPVTIEDCCRQLGETIRHLDKLAETANLADAQKYHLVCAHVQMGLDLLRQADRSEP
jgi:hypothetical protein